MGLPIVRARVVATEAAARICLDDAAENGESGRLHVDAYGNGSNKWIHPAGEWADSRQIAFIFLTATVTLDAYAAMSHLARILHYWSEATTAYAHMCEIAEIISPYSLDHIAWAFGMLKFIEMEVPTASSICVRQSRLYAKHVVRI